MDEVTRFQAARPLLRWSRVPKKRARLNGSWKVVDTVAISPIREVMPLSAATNISGSCEPMAPWAPNRSRSAVNRKSICAFSARSAIRRATSSVERDGSIAWS
jgi:hypothetical protein